MKLLLSTVTCLVLTLLQLQSSCAFLSTTKTIIGREHRKKQQRQLRPVFGLRMAEGDDGNVVRPV